LIKTLFGLRTTDKPRGGGPIGPLRRQAGDPQLDPQPVAGAGRWRAVKPRAERNDPARIQLWLVPLGSVTLSPCRLRQKGGKVGESHRGNLRCRWRDATWSRSQRKSIRAWL
jgi:hypothetical protein